LRGREHGNVGCLEEDEEAEGEGAEDGAEEGDGLAGLRVVGGGCIVLV
jgi:hypothetical protein